MDIIFSDGLFPAASRLDATAAVQLLASTVTRRRGLQVKPVVHFAENPAEIRSRLKSGFSGILILDVISCLQLAGDHSIEPILSAVRSDGATSYTLLVRNDPALASLDSLRGKRLIVNLYSSANLGQIWLDALLRDNRLDVAGHHFGSIQTVTKSSAAILPLFFKKADAAVVDQASFQVNKELNPALGTALRIFATAPPYPEGIICLSRNIENRDALLTTLRELHHDAEGRQILTLFRLSHLTPLDLALFEQVRQLQRRPPPAPH